MGHDIKSELELIVANTVVNLKSDGSVFLPGHKILLVADLHLGKDTAFRAAGVPVPQGCDAATLQQLSRAIFESKAERLVVLGDLIHNRNSISDQVSHLFSRWREQVGDVTVELIRGNHDHRVTFPASWNLQVRDSLIIDSLQLVHDPIEPRSDSSTPAAGFRIGGHWHPVVMLGKLDRIRLKCFVQHDRALILPAFGMFKGGYLIDPAATTGCYPICEQGIFHWRREEKKKPA